MIYTKNNIYQMYKYYRKTKLLIAGEKQKTLRDFLSKILLTKYLKIKIFH